MGIILDEITIMNLAGAKPGCVEEILFQIRDRMKRMSLGSGGSIRSKNTGKSSAIRTSNQSLFENNNYPQFGNMGGIPQNFSYPQALPPYFNQPQPQQQQGIIPPGSNTQTPYLPSLIQSPPTEVPQVSRTLTRQQTQQRNSNPKQFVIDDESIISAKLQEKDRTINELKETVEILQLKIQKLEQLLQLKDRKIDELSSGPSRRSK